MKTEKIKAFAIKNGYDDVLFLNKWRGFDCYEPIFKGEDPSFIGPPLMIMLKGGLIRMSTLDEAMAHVEESE